VKRLIPLGLAALLYAPEAQARPDSRQVTSTGYCLTGTTASGYRLTGSPTVNMRRTVASNDFRLGTRLYIKPSPTGMRHFIVRDRIGHGTQLDFWIPKCGNALRWGRRTVTIRVR
jgi:3D (Asp-Asp-Asp) domain-containing protein